MKQKPFQTIVALVVAALAVGPIVPAMAAPAPARLDGRVFSPDLSRPVPDLSVSLIPEGAAEPAARTTTDRKGRFEFEGLAAGRYVLLLSSQAGQPVAAANVEALSGQDQRITLALPPVAPAQAGDDGGGRKGFAHWISTPVGATITAVVAAVIVGVAVDSAVSDDTEEQALSPVVPPPPPTLN